MQTVYVLSVGEGVDLLVHLLAALVVLEEEEQVGHPTGLQVLAGGVVVVVALGKVPLAKVVMVVFLVVAEALVLVVLLVQEVLVAVVVAQGVAHRAWQVQEVQEEVEEVEGAATLLALALAAQVLSHLHGRRVINHEIRMDRRWAHS